jgi:hypothetical protein
MTKLLAMCAVLALLSTAAFANDGCGGCTSLGGPGFGVGGAINTVPSSYAGLMASGTGSTNYTGGGGATTGSNPGFHTGGT